jgi:HD superfamily phosphohydrolase
MSSINNNSNEEVVLAAAEVTACESPPASSSSMLTIMPLVRSNTFDASYARIVPRQLVTGDDSSTTSIQKPTLQRQLSDAYEVLRASKSAVPVQLRRAKRLRRVADRSRWHLRAKVLKCNVHNRIKLSNLAIFVIDHWMFQKMRDKKQLAHCEKVFPGATHTRFAHSIGTYHLARLMARRIRDNSDSVELQSCLDDLNQRFGIRPVLSDELIEFIAIAGLCHDLGHGPFSHQFDSVLEDYGMSENDPQFPYAKHEYRSGAILEHILNGIVTAGEIAFMRELINPPKGIKGWVYQIVSNGLNDIDCDKADYVLRDSMYLDVPVSFDLGRIIMDLAVVDGDVCYPSQECNALYKLFVSRFELFMAAYSHRAVRCLNRMMTLAMRNLDLTELMGSVKSGNMEVFCKYGDSRVVMMLEDDSGDAGEMWERVVNRELYHSIGEVRMCAKTEHEVQQRVTAIMRVWQSMYPDDADEFEMLTAKIGYLSGNKPNPIDILPLYAERPDGSKERKRANRDEITTLMPAHHQETTLLLIYKGFEDKRPYVERFRQMKEALMQ